MYTFSSSINALLWFLIVAVLPAQTNLAGVASLYRESYRGSLEMVTPLRCKTLGNRHRDTLTLINNLGPLLLKQGDLVSAAPLLREALQVSLCQAPLTAILLACGYSLMCIGYSEILVVISGSGSQEPAALRPCALLVHSLV